LWIKRGSDLYLVAFASVMDESGKPGGGLVVGTTLNDLLSRASDATAGGGLVLASPGEKDGWNVVARSTAGAEALVEALKSPIGARLGQDISGGHVSAELANNLVITAVPLQGYVDGKGAALVAGAPAERIENAAALVTPILPILVLGLGLVVLGGIFLGNYIDRPIAMLEEGLLSIINGQADKRFELDHSELGGLAFRIDQLLNQLMGVEEDNSDEDGRLPSSSNQGDYAAGMQTGTGTVQGGANAGGHDGNDEYYGRLYSEYIEAKKGLGEQTSHITKEAFISRIQGMERDAAQKLGRSVRYQVKATGTEVTLVAVPV
jgi:hypothetical protein